MAGCLRGGSLILGRSTPPDPNPHVRSQISDESRQGHSKGFGEPSQDIETRIPFAALDAADVGPVQVGSLRELFLGKP